MSGWGKYVVAGLFTAIVAHVVFINAVPRVLMNVAIDRLSHGHFNQWRVADRVTQASRTIVRPSPDFAYAACPYDLGSGPISIKVAPWGGYWSLSLYAANSDNYYVLDDREARQGADITLVRDGASPPEHAATVVESPSTRGIALIRRLAPTPDDYAAAARTAHDDVCTALARAAG